MPTVGIWSQHFVCRLYLYRSLYEVLLSLPPNNNYDESVIKTTVDPSRGEGVVEEDAWFFSQVKCSIFLGKEIIKI